MAARSRAGAASSAQARPVVEVRRPLGARRAVDVAERRARLGDGRRPCTSRRRRRASARAPARAATRLRGEPARPGRRRSAARASGAVQCVWWPSGPSAAASRARSSQRCSSSPKAGSGGRSSEAIGNPPGAAAQQAAVAPPDLVVERAARRGTRRPRTVRRCLIPRQVSRGARCGRARRLRRRVAAPGRARGRARARSSRSSSRRRTRSHGRSSRAARSASCRASPPRTRSRSTRSSSPGSTGRSGAPGSSSGWRRRWSPSRTALLVLEIGRRLRSTCRRRRRRADRDAAPVRRLARRPRQPGDPRRLPARRADARSRSRPSSGARSRSPPRRARSPAWPILGNSRLALLPLAARRLRRLAGPAARRARSRPAPRLVAAALVVVSPWLDPQRGLDRLPRDHDRRAGALEGEQPDDVRRAGARPVDRRRAGPAGRAALAGARRSAGPRRGAGGGRVRADAPLPRRGARLLARAPGREGAARRPGRADAVAADVHRRGRRRGARRRWPRRDGSVVEPLYMLAALRARAGRGSSSRRAASWRSRLLLLAYNTLAAMVFAGTVRYRAPFDFLLALLAAFALERAWAWWGSRAPRPARASAAR